MVTGGDRRSSSRETGRASARQEQQGQGRVVGVWIWSCPSARPLPARKGLQPRVGRGDRKAAPAPGSWRKGVSLKRFCASKHCPRPPICGWNCELGAHQEALPVRVSTGLVAGGLGALPVAAIPNRASRRSPGTAWLAVRAQRGGR